MRHGSRQEPSGWAPQEWVGSPGVLAETRAVGHSPLDASAGRLGRGGGSRTRDRRGLRGLGGTGWGRTHLGMDAQVLAGAQGQAQERQLLALLLLVEGEQLAQFLDHLLQTAVGSGTPPRWKPRPYPTTGLPLGIPRAGTSPAHLFNLRHRPGAVDELGHLQRIRLPTDRKWPQPLARPCPHPLHRLRVGWGGQWGSHSPAGMP